ncbi:MAG: hypothetical protein MI685_10850 [Chlorobiales bacterium]|nr:hypothetical protein [Chlorobiales bacterium]
MNVKLRKRLISAGKRYSLQLDFSPPIPDPVKNKKVRFYTLGLYLHAKPKTSIERKENREKHALAESVKSRIYLWYLRETILS